LPTNLKLVQKCAVLKNVIANNDVILQSNEFITASNLYPGSIFASKVRAPYRGS
jgi:hypothetical protein